MTTLQCAICGKDQEIQELFKANFLPEKITSETFSARRIPDRIHFRFVKCIRCGLLFSNPILSAGEITKLYAKSKFTYTVESDYLKKTYGYYLKKVLNKKKRSNISLLDIGCGNGFFLEEAITMGVKNVWGIEPGEASVKKAPKWLQKNIKVNMFKKDIFKKNLFDIVCCFQTLDHIIDPNRFLSAVHMVLKKEGKALFIVHDTDGLSVKIFGEKSPIFDIEHIYLFNKKSLAKLFEKNGFTVLETFTVKNRYPLRYWIRMSPLHNSIKIFITSVLQLLSLDNASITISAGNIGILVKR
ncbi:MAG TPA: class I SAM-dependent methyltransferase [Candidatus Acidoferrales bacterium]|nr:class I SAM-dependent methyltransferase [Candidatus Acidoferrales bacterium]